MTREVHPEYPDRDTKGRLLPGTNMAITSQNARERQVASVDKRRENQREENELAMMAALRMDHPELDLDTPEQHAAFIVAQQTRKAADPVMPGSTAAARFVFQETGRSQERQATTQHTTVNMLPDSVMIEVGRLLSMVTDHAQPDIVEGEYREGHGMSRDSGSVEGTNREG